MWVVEGDAKYEPPRQAWRALRRMRRWVRAPQQLVLSATETSGPARRGFGAPRRIASAWLALQREPFRWRTEPTALARALAALGFAIQRAAGIAGPMPPAAITDNVALPPYGEMLLLAEHYPLQEVPAARTSGTSGIEPVPKPCTNW